MNISNYTFPVVERALAVHNGQRDDAHFLQPETHLSGPYKALVREDTNELISVVKDTYQLVQNDRMRLQITFPELFLQDSLKDLKLQALSQEIAFLKKRSKSLLIKNYMHGLNGHAVKNADGRINTSYHG